MQDLHANLAEQGVDVRAVPLVFQYNKQDLPRDLILTTEELRDAINFRGVPTFRPMRCTGRACSRRCGAFPSWY